MKPIWRSLEIPWLYDLFSYGVGANRFYRRLLRDYAQVQTGEQVLDIGCGTGRILKLLPDVKYLGFDPNPDYISTAKKTLGQRGRFITGAIGENMNLPENTFDLVFALGILHHLPDPLVLELAALAHKSLRPGGRLVTSDGAFAPDQGKLARAMVARDRGRFVRPAESYLRLLGNSFSKIRSDVIHDGVRIPYTHLITTCIKT